MCIRVLQKYCFSSVYRLSTLWSSVKFPDNGTEEKEKQPSATHIVIMLDILMFTDSQTQTTFSTTANLCCWVIWPWIFPRYNKWKG